ncbi:MAG: hypothetical protein AAF621_04665 [Pseudomonadota bacterium]
MVRTTRNRTDRAVVPPDNKGKAENAKLIPPQQRRGIRRNKAAIGTFVGLFNFVTSDLSTNASDEKNEIKKRRVKECAEYLCLNQAPLSNSETLTFVRGHLTAAYEGDKRLTQDRVYNVLIGFFLESNDTSSSQPECEDASREKRARTEEEREDPNQLKIPQASEIKGPQRKRYKRVQETEKVPTRKKRREKTDPTPPPPKRRARKGAYSASPLVNSKNAIHPKTAASLIDYAGVTDPHILFEMLRNGELIINSFCQFLSRNAAKISKEGFKEKALAAVEEKLAKDRKKIEENKDVRKFIKDVGKFIDVIKLIVARVKKDPKISNFKAYFIEKLKETGKSEEEILQLRHKGEQEKKKDSKANKGVPKVDHFQPETPEQPAREGTKRTRSTTRRVPADEISLDEGKGASEHFSPVRVDDSQFGGGGDEEQTEGQVANQSNDILAPQALANLPDSALEEVIGYQQGQGVPRDINTDADEYNLLQWLHES